MIRVAAAVIEKQGKILITRRRKGGPFGELWEFPGGKVEPGENLRECLRRELMEELGIEARIEELIGSSRYDYGHLDVELYAYRVTAFSGEIRLHEHEEARWIRPADMVRYDFPEADRPICEKLMSQSASEVP